MKLIFIGSLILSSCFNTQKDSSKRKKKKQNKYETHYDVFVKMRLQIIFISSFLLKINFLGTDKLPDISNFHKKLKNDDTGL